MMLCDKIEKADLPFFISSMQGAWFAEEKFDGDRIRMQIKDGNIKLFNRRGAEVTDRYPEFYPIHNDRDMLLDGEMCVLDANGLSQFNEGIAFRTHCQNPDAILEAAEAYPVTYVIFDVLEIDGNDIRDRKLIERRVWLESLDFKGPFKVSEATDDIAGMWKKVTSLGGEGIIIKKKDSPYLEGKRSSMWRKVKDIKESDIFVTSYKTNPKGIRVETNEGIACQVAGYNAPPVKEMIDTNGKAQITIRHLGCTQNGKFRQPVFCKIVEG